MGAGLRLCSRRRHEFRALRRAAIRRRRRVMCGAGRGALEASGGLYRRPLLQLRRSGPRRRRRDADRRDFDAGLRGVRRRAARLRSTLAMAFAVDRLLRETAGGETDARERVPAGHVVRAGRVALLYARRRAPGLVRGHAFVGAFRRGVDRGIRPRARRPTRVCRIRLAVARRTSGRDNRGSVRNHRRSAYAGAGRLLRRSRVNGSPLRRTLLALAGVGISAAMLRAQLSDALVVRGDEFLYRAEPARALAYYRRALAVDRDDGAAGGSLCIRRNDAARSDDARGEPQ